MAETPTPDDLLNSGIEKIKPLPAAHREVLARREDVPSLIEGLFAKVEADRANGDEPTFDVEVVDLPPTEARHAGWDSPTTVEVDGPFVIPDAEAKEKKKED